jgi:hypothetical protein
VPDVQVNDCRLQDAPIEITDRVCFLPPGSLQGFMGFEVLPDTDQLQSLDRPGMERCLAV